MDLHAGLNLVVVEAVLMVPVALVVVVDGEVVVVVMAVVGWR
jgi:hypothetical protein